MDVDQKEIELVELILKEEEREITDLNAVLQMTEDSKVKGYKEEYDEYKASTVFEDVMSIHPSVSSDGFHLKSIDSVADVCTLNIWSVWFCQ